MSNWIHGCDVCQDVWPFNHISLEKIIEMDYNSLRDVVQPKFRYIEKDKVWKWKTNALNAMVNSHKRSYDKFIDIACNDENENVRRMGEWAKRKLAPTK